MTQRSPNDSPDYTVRVAPEALGKLAAILRPSGTEPATSPCNCFPTPDNPVHHPSCPASWKAEPASGVEADELDDWLAVFEDAFPETAEEIRRHVEELREHLAALRSSPPTATTTYTREDLEAVARMVLDDIGVCDKPTGEKCSTCDHLAAEGVTRYLASKEAEK